MTLVICVVGTLGGLWLASGSTVQEVIDSHQAETTAKKFRKAVTTTGSMDHKQPETVVSIPTVGIYQPVYSMPSGLNYGVYGSGDEKIADQIKAQQVYRNSDKYKRMKGANDRG